MHGAAPAIKCEAGEAGGAGACDPQPAYSLHVNLGSLGGLLAESGGNTPRTPEILNSLIAMTSPLDHYSYGADRPTPFQGVSCQDSNSSISSGSPVTSPASHTTPSIQKTCSELIKAGLKLSIESKRKMSGSECSESGGGGGGTGLKRLKREEEPSEEDYDSGHTSFSKSEGLTPEDEERRRRRRERNKIAATKCRLKKRERTVNLVTESEVLESQNVDLKSQLQELEVQRRQLLDMLSVHTASCLRHALPAPAPAPPAAPSPYPPAYEPPSPYLRPEAADLLPASYHEADEPSYLPSLAPLAPLAPCLLDDYPDAYARPGPDYYDDSYPSAPPPAPPAASASPACLAYDRKLGQGLHDGCLA